MNATARFILLSITFFTIVSCTPDRRENNNAEKTVEHPAGYIDSTIIHPYPFTIPSGTMSCEDGAVYFNADGRKFAVNGVAKGRIGTGLSAGADVLMIWKDDPAMPGLKISLGRVIPIGLELCR